MNKGPDHKGPEKARRSSPPELLPPDALHPQEPLPSRNLYLWVAGCGLLLVLLTLVVVFLPNPTPPIVAPPVQPPSQPPSVSISSTADQEELREVNLLMVQWLKGRAAAEAESTAEWGGETYRQAVSLAEDCDRQLSAGQPVLARPACEEAIARLEKLVASKESLFSEALAAGNSALSAGEFTMATEAFRTALSIHPDHADAAIGLQRAEQLPEVLRLMENAEKLERGDDLTGAKEALSAAVTMDPDYLPAREQFDRVEAILIDKEFRQHMSEALQAMEAGHLVTAGRALTDARKLSPDHPALLDLQEQLARTRLSRSLESLRAQAVVEEQKENWSSALELCQKALKLDSHAAFALGCKNRVSPRIELDQALSKILAVPNGLFETARLQQARVVLERASKVDPRGPRLAAQIDQLTEQIHFAEAEVDVVIRSDGLTEVSIYHVGRLGRLEQKALTLRTGDYIATGSRNGFRDVRQTLKVRPGQGVLTFFLRCEDPI